MLEGRTASDIGVDGNPSRVAKEHGIQVIVLAHHNLLQESRLFTTQCEMENGPEVTALLEKYQVPLYISGHLHVQRIRDR